MSKFSGGVAMVVVTTLYVLVIAVFHPSLGVELLLVTLDLVVIFGIRRRLPRGSGSRRR